MLKNFELKMEKVVWQGNFEEAEAREIALYAAADWKESAAIVENLRKAIWNQAYREKVVWSVQRSKLKEERDDFE